MRRIIIVLVGALAVIATGALLVGAPSQAQSPFGSQNTAPLNVAATTVGTTSTMWAIDARTSQIIFCTAVVGGAPSCKSVAMPGAAQP